MSANKARVVRKGRIYWVDIFVVILAIAASVVLIERGLELFFGR